MHMYPGSCTRSCTCTLHLSFFTSCWTQCEMFSILVGLGSFSFYQRRMLNQPYHPIQQVQWEWKASLSYLHWCPSLTMDFHKCTVKDALKNRKWGWNNEQKRQKNTISTQETTRKIAHLAMPSQKNDGAIEVKKINGWILPHNIA